MTLEAYLLISIIVLLVIAVVVSTIMLVKILKFIRSSLDSSISVNEQKIQSIQQDIAFKSPEYSEKVMEFGQKFTAQSTVIKFKEFVDGHDWEKMTEGQIKKLIFDISTNINISIDYDHIDFNRTIFTKEYFYQIIVNTVSATVKSLMERE